jgi:hypothetical protein
MRLPQKSRNWKKISSENGSSSAIRHLKGISDAKSKESKKEGWR